jgi:hypothetical protein
MGGIIRPIVNASPLTWVIRYIYHRNLQFLNYVIMFKTKVLLLQALVTLSDLGCPLWTLSDLGYPVWTLSDLGYPVWILSDLGYPV